LTLLIHSLCTINFKSPHIYNFLDPTNYVISSKKNYSMEIFCVHIINEGKGPSEIVFSALSSSDAKNMVNEKYPNCEIISIKEFYDK